MIGETRPIRQGDTDVVARLASGTRNGCHPRLGDGRTTDLTTLITNKTLDLTQLIREKTTAAADLELRLQIELNLSVSASLWRCFSYPPGSIATTGWSAALSRAPAVLELHFLAGGSHVACLASPSAVRQLERSFILVAEERPGLMTPVAADHVGISKLRICSEDRRGDLFLVHKQILAAKDLACRRSYHLPGHKRLTSHETCRAPAGRWNVMPAPGKYRVSDGV